MKDWLIEQIHDFELLAKYTLGDELKDYYKGCLDAYTQALAHDYNAPEIDNSEYSMGYYWALNTIKRREELLWVKK